MSDSWQEAQNAGIDKDFIPHLQDATHAVKVGVSEKECRDSIKAAAPDASEAWLDDKIGKAKRAELWPWKDTE